MAHCNASDRIRTCYHRIRSPVLYPDELRAQIYAKKSKGAWWGLNPRQPDPQSGALPLNYRHQVIDEKHYIKKRAHSSIANLKKTEKKLHLFFLFEKSVLTKKEVFYKIAHTNQEWIGRLILSSNVLREW